MASFTKGNNILGPFGKNSFLRSTKDVKTEPYTCASGAVATEVDPAGTNTPQKILQAGEVMCKITSGPDAGKVGPFDASATDGRQLPAGIVGINSTFLPWTLLVRDVEIAVVYECTAVQGWCFERLNGARIVLTNATADACRGVRGMDIHFH